MKKLFVLLVVALFNAGLYAQNFSVAELGNSIIVKDNLKEAEQVFKKNGLFPFDRQSDTDFVCSIGNGSKSACMGSVKSFSASNQQIKEASFLIGEKYQKTLLADLERLGYKCLSKELEYVELFGAKIPQSTYGNENRRCLVRDMEDGFLQVIFKNVENTTSDVKSTTDAPLSIISIGERILQRNPDMSSVAKILSENGFTKDYEQLSTYIASSFRMQYFMGTADNPTLVVYVEKDGSRNDVVVMFVFNPMDEFDKQLPKDLSEKSYKAIDSQIYPDGQMEEYSNGSKTNLKVWYIQAKEKIRVDMSRHYGVF